MFCDACGTQLQTSQKFCSGCGRAVTAGFPLSPQRSRIREHVRLLAIFWFAVLGIFVLAKAAAGFFAGWGLLNREPWARVVTLVVGFLALLHPPLGTALGVYTLWVLLPADAEAEYSRYQNAAAA